MVEHISAMIPVLIAITFTVISYFRIINVLVPNATRGGCLTSICVQWLTFFVVFVPFKFLQENLKKKKSIERIP